MERTITMTDAVVAIAMTLLVLPLVELAPEVDLDDVWHGLGEHRDVFAGFVLSFLVIYTFWRAHEQIFAGLAEVPGSVRILNMLWLLVVAFLPFPTALVGRQSTTSTTPFYIGTMLVLSALTSAMSTVAARHRGTVPSGWRVGMAWVTTSVFAVCGLIALVSPEFGLLGLLALLLVRIVEMRGPLVRRHEPAVG